MTKPFQTILAAASGEITISKSRFIFSASPCQSEEEALSFLCSVRRQYRDASHHCYAYIIGKNSGVMRYSDDGEPGGTAGMPIIEVMKAQGVVDVCVVVTRYFGGVLLGAGGLTRAYAKSCALALKAARVVSMEPSQRWRAKIGYSQWDRVLHALKSQPVQIEETAFSASVDCTLLMRERDAETVLAALTALTDGRIAWSPAGDLFYPWEDSAR